jgi:hypothetical protein
MTSTTDEKEIRWVGSSYTDVLTFPKRPQREAGAGTRDVRISDAKGIFRVVVRREVRGSGLCPALLPENDAGHVEAGQGRCCGALTRRGKHEKGQAMTIDTEVRHVTKPGANLFLELGFSAA